jgi:hypothetical protein
VTHLIVLVVSSQSLQPIAEVQVEAAAGSCRAANRRQVKPIAKATLLFMVIISSQETRSYIAIT